MTNDPANLPVPLPEGTGAPARSRRFTSEEVDEVLRLAAPQEVRAGVPSPHDATLEDLMVAAAEVGLDPAAVRRAASIVPAPKGGLAALILGAPDRRQVRAILDDASLPAERTEVARASERLFGRRGEVLKDDSAHFVWRENHGIGRTTVELTGSGHGTELRVEADRAGHYLAGWFAGLAGWGALSALTPLGALGPVGGVLSLLAVPFLLARPFWKHADKRLQHRLEDLTLELARVVEEHGPAALPGPDDKGAG
jgi:hypothetical protein